MSAGQRAPPRGFQTFGDGRARPAVFEVDENVGMFIIVTQLLLDA
jgi:hypothetical protein